MKQLKTLLWLLTGLLGIEAEARELGADVFYKRIDSMRYEITFVRYRNCQDYSSMSAVFSVYNDSFELVLTPKKTSSVSVQSQVYCPGLCNGGVSNGTPGIEQYTFVDTIDFNAGLFRLFGSKNYPKVYFGLSFPTRFFYNTLFTGDYTFVEAMLDLQYVRSTGETSGFSGFINPVEQFFLHQSPISYSFISKPLSGADSLVYGLVRAKRNKNTDYVYNAQKPLTIFCADPKSQSCKPSKTYPPAGMYFNPANGNLICTPVKDNEYGLFVCKVDLYRQLNGTPVLIGYMKRDFMFKIQSQAYYNPVTDNYRDQYSKKAREEICLDIPIKDKAAFSQISGDTLLLEFPMGLPEYGQLSVSTDSGRNKTIHYCWTPSDSDYLLKHVAEINYRVIEKTCVKMNTYSMSGTVSVNVTAPDSFSFFRIKTYYDRNGNGKKDASEYYAPGACYLKNGQTYTAFNTPDSGKLFMKQLHGKYSFGIRETAMIIPMPGTAVLDARFDSTYTIELGFKYRHGIRGFVYEDRNSNCVYDLYDRLIEGQSLTLKGGETVVQSDAEGKFFIQAAPGNYTLTCMNGPYDTTCTGAYAVQMIADSVQLGFGFAMQKKQVFNDVAVEMQKQEAGNGNTLISEKIKIINKGVSNTGPVRLMLLPSKPISIYSSSVKFTLLADTIVFISDDLPEGGFSELQFSHFVDSDSISLSEPLCLKAFTGHDSLPENNEVSMCIFPPLAGVMPFKTALHPAQISSETRYISYSVAFKDSVYPHFRAFMRDTLNKDVFDLSSFRVLENKSQCKVNLIGNVLFAEYNKYIDPGKEIGITYSLKLKSPADRSYPFSNTAVWYTDVDDLFGRGTASLSTVSAIGISPLNDTVFCPREQVALAITCRYAPYATNRFKVYLSDAYGNFANKRLLLDTQSNARANWLKFGIPADMPAGSLYRLRITGDHPAYTVFDDLLRQTIDILPLPAIRISSNIVSGEICSSDSLKLNVQGLGLVKFFINGFDVEHDSSLTAYQYKPLKNGNAFAMLKDLNNCVSYSENLSYKIRPLPVIQPALVPPVVCSGDSGILDINSNSRFSIYRDNILWKSQVGKGYFPTGALTAGTTYLIVALDTIGCTSSASVIMKVNPLPAKPLITQIKNYLSSSFPVSNQWTLGAYKIAGATARIFYPTFNAGYRVQYTDSNGCVSVSDEYNFERTSVHADTTINAIKIYPVPASDVLHVDNSSRESVLMQLYSNDGKCLISLDILPGDNTLALSEYQVGIYFVRFIFEGMIEQRVVCVGR